MTTNELHKILDNENKKLSIKELKEVIYELKQDCIREQANNVSESWQDHFYTGETNAFQIALDLLEHLEVNND